MGNKIQCVSEAFSMQPKCYAVGHRLPTNPDVNIHEIRLETIQLGTKYGDPVEEPCYVGYDAEGQTLFHCLAVTMNVEYK